MAALTLHAEALALFDELTAAQAVLSVSEGGRLAIEAGALSEALGARLSAFCGTHGGRREGLDRYRALRAVVRAPSRAARELLGLPVAYTVGLPAPFTARFVRGKQVCVCTTSRHAYAAAVTRGEPAFLLRELEAVALAVAQGRASGADLEVWAAAKLRTPDWRVTLDLVGLEGSPAATSSEVLITWGELLDALGAELLGVEVHDVLDQQLRKGAA